MSEYGADQSPASALPARTIGTIVSRFGILFGSAIAGILVARTLGPSGQARVATVMAFVAITQGLANLSVPSAQIYLWGSSEYRRSLVANSAVLSGTLGVVGGLCLVGVTRLLPVGSLARQNWIPMVVGACAIPLLLAGASVSEIATLKGTLGRVNVGQTLATGVEALLIAGLVLGGRLTVLLAVLAWTASVALPLPVIWSGLRPRMRDLSWGLARRTVAIGLRYHSAASFQRLLYRLDLLVLNLWVGATQIGLYSVAVMVAEVTIVFTDAVTASARSRQVGMALPEAAAFTIRVFRINLITGMTAFLVIGGTSFFMIPMVYGNNFRGSVASLLVLGPAVVALGTTSITCAYLVRLARPGLFVAIDFSALALNALLLVTVVPAVGIVGASLASSIAYMAMAAAYASWLARVAGTSPRELVPRPRDVTETIALARPLVSRLRRGVVQSEARQS